MSKEILKAQKTSYETQYKQAETRLGQLTAEVERVTVQREQLRGAIYAIDQVMVAMDAPQPTSPRTSLKAVDATEAESKGGPAPEAEAKDGSEYPTEQKTNYEEQVN